MTTENTSAQNYTPRFAVQGSRVEIPAEFRRTTDAYAGLVVAVNVVGAPAAGIAAAWLDVWWAYALGFVLAGRQLYALYILQHEALHWTLFSSRRWNDAVGTLLSSMLGSRLTSSRTLHFKHHAIVGQPDDPNQFFYATANKAPGWPVLRFLAGQALGFRLAQFLQVLLSSLRMSRSQPEGQSASWTSRGGVALVFDLAAVVIVQGAMLALFATSVGPLYYFLLYCLPLVTVTSGLDATRAFTEHVLPGERPRNWAEETRNYYVISSHLERFFLAPFGFHWHHVHHLYMDVPGYRLGPLHQWLQTQDPAFHQRYATRTSYLGILRGYLAHTPVDALPGANRTQVHP